MLSPVVKYFHFLKESSQSPMEWASSTKARTNTTEVQTHKGSSTTPTTNPTHPTTATTTRKPSNHRENAKARPTANKARTSRAPPIAPRVHCTTNTTPPTPPTTPPTPANPPTQPRPTRYPQPNHSHPQQSTLSTYLSTLMLSSKPRTGQNARKEQKSLLPLASLACVMRLVHSSNAQVCARERG